MGLSTALYTAITGLQGTSQAMTVTGNNIANSSTVGFKSSSTLFSDLLSANIASSSGNSQGWPRSTSSDRSNQLQPRWL